MGRAGANECDDVGSRVKLAVPVRCGYSSKTQARGFSRADVHSKHTQGLTSTMSRGDLQQLVAQGEGLRLEFKHRLPEPERVVRELTALANTSGGYLLIGIADDGRIRGVKDPEEEVYALNSAIKQYCFPEVAVELERVRVSRTRTVVIVKTSASPMRPHYVRNPCSQGRCVFVRFEDMCIEASREARKLMYSLPDSENVLIKLGAKERLLLKQLEQKGRVTVYGFAKYAKIHPGRASRIIVRMTRAKILVHHIDLEDDYFTAGAALLW